MFKQEVSVKLTHDTKYERGSEASLSYIFTNPPEGKRRSNLLECDEYIILLTE